MAAGEGRVLAAGSVRDVMAFRGRGTKLLDLGAATVIPGVVDAHLHLLGLGLALAEVDLTGARSWDEAIARVAARARAARPGEWIRGRGWDQNRWPDQTLPGEAPLSRAVAANPAALTRVDGHAILLNAAALRLAGITSATPDPPGGRIARRPDGSPTGLLLDNAMALATRVLPAPSPAETRAAALAAIRHVHRHGLVGVHEPWVTQATIAVYEELAGAGRFALRDYVMIAADPAGLGPALARGPRSALYGGRLWLRAWKAFADGALGSRGAALLEPYDDDPGNAGLLLSDAAEIRRLAAQALRLGFQLCVHAIGDRANRLVLDAYQAALAAAPAADHRFRIEHAQVLSPPDIPRFAALGVIPSMQTSHAASDRPWAAARLGPARARGAYAWRALLDTGVVVPNGSDAPVEPVNPLLGFHAAITREEAAGGPAGGAGPAPRMTREEALRSLTRWPAYAAFMEREAGSIAPGKYADFTVLDRDLMTVAPDELLATNVVMTILDGEIVYG